MSGLDYLQKTASAMAAAAESSDDIIAPPNSDGTSRSITNDKASDEPAAVSAASETSASIKYPHKQEMDQLQSQMSTSSTLSTVSVVEEAPVKTPIEGSSTSNTIVQQAPPPRQVSNNINGTEKNPLQMFNEYVVSLFQKAEVYEQELERRESKSDLHQSLDQVRHGAAGVNAVVADSTTVRIEKNINSKAESSPRLSPTSEAVAAVEAMSTFRSFSQVKREVSFRSDTDKAQDVKKLKSDKDTQDITDAMLAEDDIQEKWNRFCDLKRQDDFGEVAIESISLSMTVDELYELVLKDNASSSIGRFMAINGDIDVETTPWEPSNARLMTRTIHYTHPVNVPMAPPNAKAFKRQYLHKFGTLGLCLESSTIVEDVPMTDCFVVDDRLWVHHNEQGGCTMKVTYQIRFVKTTMFRRIIENATRSEFEKWWSQFGHMVIALQPETCGGSTDEEDFELVAKELEEITQMFDEGQEVSLPDTLKKIRSSSQRLSMVARRSSMRRVSKTAVPKAGLGVTSIYEYIVPAVEKCVLVLKDENYSEHIHLGIFGLTILMVILNLWTCRQLIVTNQTLSELDGHVRHLSLANEILLSRLDQTATCSK